jgi:hypothetical protein
MLMRSKEDYSVKMSSDEEILIYLRGLDLGQLKHFKRLTEQVFREHRPDFHYDLAKVQRAVLDQLPHSYDWSPPAWKRVIYDRERDALKDLAYFETIFNDLLTPVQIQTRQTNGQLTRDFIDAYTAYVEDLIQTEESAIRAEQSQGQKIKVVYNSATGRNEAVYT